MKENYDKLVISKTFGLALISVIQKVLGLFKNLIFSFLYGTTNISDAFNISLTIPDTFYSLFSNGINSSFIPLYTAEKELVKKKKFTSDTITTIILVTFLVCFLSFCFLKYIVFIFAPGFDFETRTITIQLVSISIWSIIFSGASNLLISYLQAENCFIRAELTIILLNIFQIVGIIISYYKQHFWLAIGILVGSIVQNLILVFLAARRNYKVSLSVPNRKTIKQICALALPIFLSASANRINVLIDKAIASSIVIGGISALAYADSIVLFIKGVFGTPVITTVFPQLAFFVNEDSTTKVTELMEDSIEKILFYILPICISCMFVSEEVVTIIYKRGAFSQQSVFLTAECLKWYSIGLPAFCIRDLLVRLFYAKKDASTPTKNLFIGIAINLFLNFLLSNLFGLKGLAMATSISAFFILGLLYKSQKRKGIYHITRNVVIKILKISLSSLLMLVCLIWAKKLMFRLSSVLVRTSLLFIAGLTSYCFFILITKTYTIKVLLERLMMK